MRWILPCLLFVLCWSSAPALAKDDVVDADTFDAGLKRLEGYLDRRRYSKGLMELQKLLRKHERKPWAIGHRAALEDLAERLAFGDAFPAPKAQDVVSGRIEKWEPRKGTLRVRDDREDSDDLRRGGEYVYFPARARGSYLLEIYGSSYPYDFDDAPVLEIAAGPHPKTKRQQNWFVSFGSPAREEDGQKTWLPARIIHMDGETQKTVSEVAANPAKFGKRFLLQLKVNDTRIHAAVNRKAVGTAKKPRGLYGELRFKVPQWETVIFHGQIEPSWIQDRLDKVVEGQRAKFERTYSREDHLPRWLFEAPDLTAVEAARKVLPTKLPKTYERDAQALVRALRMQDSGRARASLAKLTSAGAPAPVLDFFLARIELQDGRAEQGLEAVGRVLQEDPEFMEGQLLQGVFFRMLGREEETLETLHRALQCHPEDPRAYKGAIHSMLMLGRADAAARVVKTAARNGVVSDELDGLARAVTKANEGPAWNRVYEYKSRNYHVLSNTDKETCVEASKLLEQALTAYKVNFHWVGRSSERQYKVFLFGGKAGFMRYWQDLEAFVGHAPENVAGVYIPVIQQLLVWTLGDKDEMLRTIRHEGFHQYLDRLMKNVPVWLNEGLAVYHENGVFERGRLRFGKIHPARRDLLRKEGLRPLTEFIWLTPEQFYFGKDAFRNYAQAWAFVHLLKEGKSRDRDLLKALIKDMQTSPPSDVLRRHLPPDRLRELDAALRAHVRRMK